MNTAAFHFIKRLLPLHASLSSFFILCLGVALGFSPLPAQGQVIINEIDVDQTSTDTMEFIELYDGGVGNTSLTGLVVVFYNGSVDTSYRAIDLDGFSTDANGYFVIGNAAVPGAQITFPNNILQNGVDAIALFVGNGTDFPTGTALTTTNLLDAIVYDAGTGTDVELMVLLNAGQPVANEDGGAGSTIDSLQRCPNGSGGARNTTSYVPATPTPGSANLCSGEPTATSTATSTATETPLFSPTPTDTPNVSSSVIINEVDCDQASTDTLEFIELYDGGAGNTSLDGLVLVFYNGSTDVSYRAIDLDTYSTNGSGYFVIGNSGVANVSITFPNGILQNGADAVALYIGNATDFPTDTAVTTTNLIDALVYGTGQAADTGLLVLLNGGQPQVNEAGGGDSTIHSMQRCPDGSGGARNTASYGTFPPTAGAENICLTPTATSSPTSTNTPTSTSTFTPTDTPIFTATSTFTPTETSTSTETATSTETPTSTNTPIVSSSVIINEVDCDQASTDTLEFIELYDGGVGNTLLDGLVLVFYNGSTDVSYRAIDLDTYSTNGGGYFVIGNSGVANVSITFPNGILQNGADAVALYIGNAADFPTDTAVTTTNLIDALVYGTGQAADTGLLVLLNALQPQVNEAGGGDSTIHSMQRCPNGSGGARNTASYGTFPPTAGVENICLTPTATSSPTSTNTPTSTSTFTPTDTPIFTATSTFTPTETSTSTETATSTETPTSTNTPIVSSSVIINEVDCDQASTDTLEFIELYDGGAGNTSLDGLVLVFYNGSTDVSYRAIDLDTYSTNGSGYFVIGNSGVANVSITFPNGILQNGADAVALYIGNAADFPTDTAVTTTNLIDALVYDTGQAADAGLLVLLNVGQPQVNEAGGGDSTIHSMQRCPDGSGGARNTVSYSTFPPSPGTDNLCVVPTPTETETPTISPTPTDTPLISPTPTDTPVVTAGIIINEVDSDQTGTDTSEFIELFDTGSGSSSLDGLVVVFYNGSTDTSYRAIDLDGYSTDVNGYFVLGNAAVPNVQITFPNGTMQNGVDAIAVYVGNGTDFPNGTTLTTTNLIDAIVYDTGTGTDAELLVLLNAGQAVVNEAGNGDSTAHSMQRCPNGTGGARNTATYNMFPPTAGTENLCIEPTPTDTVTPTPTGSVTATVTATPSGGHAFGDVVINEIAWMGTAASSVDEWIELFNTTDSAIDLSNWKILSIDGGLSMTLSGMIPAHGYFLIERGDDTTVSDIAADAIPAGFTTLSNTGEELKLTDAVDILIDSVNDDGDIGTTNGGGWPAGSSSPGYYSMERINPDVSGDVRSNWESNDGVTRNGLDFNGDPINGTPKSLNSIAGGPTPTPAFTATPTPTSSGATPTPTPFNDVDLDGLPDWWELLYFGTLAFGPSDNNDQDAYTNMQEYLNGTNPTVPDVQVPALASWALVILLIVATFLIRRREQIRISK